MTGRKRGMMKQLIKGKLYNTETAKKVGEWDNGLADSKFDSEYYKEILYIKRTREFFLYGYGKRNSKYSENTDGYWKGVEKIIPLSYDSAREWAEQHLTVIEYNSVFGAVVEDDTRTLLTLSMSVTSIEKAKRAASKAGMSLSAYIESLIQ